MKNAAMAQAVESSQVLASIVGRSPAMQRVLSRVERVAPLTSTVFITGETGTGKELIARAIHALSKRRNGRFVAVNCGAVPEGLFESELFGHLRGSFTGAVANRRGLMEEAASGTLFLDEISTVPPHVQIKLLRAIEDRAILPVGGTRPVPVDFRLVAATNDDLALAVSRGEFREDLYYRINVFPIHVPALRDRRSDIPTLAEHFRARFAARNSLVPPPFRPGMLERLSEMDWPGNVRELQNYVERAIILGAGSPDIRCETLESRAPHCPDLLRHATDAQWSLAQLEEAYILRVLEHTNGHRGLAATILGIDRRTLYRKLRSLESPGPLSEALTACASD
jgi:two-component system response regulator HydG